MVGESSCRNRGNIPAHIQVSADVNSPLFFFFFPEGNFLPFVWEPRCLPRTCWIFSQTIRLGWCLLHVDNYRLEKTAVLVGVSAIRTESKIQLLRQSKPYESCSCCGRGCWHQQAVIPGEQLQSTLMVLSFPGKPGFSWLQRLYSWNQLRPLWQ